MDSRAGVLSAALFLFLPLLFSGGCASLSSSESVGARDLLAPFFPPVERGDVRGEAEVALSAAGRTVSLPAVFRLRGPAFFRFDLLDPFDRPVAVLFPSGRKIVQYQPPAAAASAVFPFPPECEAPGPGEWVGLLLGFPQPGLDGGGWHVRRRGNGMLLARYGGAELQQEILIGEENGSLAPREATWYCRGEPVLKLRDLTYSFRDGARLPAAFDVLFPKQGLAMSVSVTAAEEVPAAEGDLPVPVLPGGIRWTSWHAVDGR